MKNLLVSLLVGLCATAFSDSHESMMDKASTMISASGQVRYRFEYRNTTSYLGNIDGLHLIRARPAFKFTPSQKFHAVFQPQFAKNFGDDVFIGSGAAANTQTETSGSGVDSDVVIHQGYVHWDATDMFAFIIGRQELSYGDQLVISPLNWHNVSRTFDALRLRVTHPLGWTDLFASKLSDNNTANIADDDKDFYGLYNGFSFGDAIQELDLYILYLQDQKSATNTDFWTFGARAKSKVGSLDYRIEANVQAGSDVSKAYQVDAEFGYSLGGLRVALEGFLAGENYNQLFPLAHGFLGWADLLGRRNLLGAALKTKFKLMDDMWFIANFFYFLRKDDATSAFRLNGSTALGTATGSTSKAIAAEIDLLLKVQATKGIHFEAGPLIVIPGSYLKDQFENKASIKAYAQLTAKF